MNGKVILNWYGRRVAEAVGYGKNFIGSTFYRKIKKEEDALMFKGV